ncbi:histidine phosphatase superfamily [Mucor mucedo]|uniref:histidine phosphatase superfamily n=1 Tax=Mucor mucedo TaxID=29922 RepID=UPI00221EEDFF|nr:histidine phosphatase superfamily [Mucor mucedo]KAI7876497.1 histidine phosphatase superfamily [Mucor mucedo]
MVSKNIPTVFIVRHGERLDHTDKLWQPDPSLGIWDPPITPKGFKQAEKTGSTILEMLRQQTIDIKNANIVIYSSPFQRCIDTSIGVVKGLRKSKNITKTPTLRIDIGLGEWMCERFFDSVCPAQYLMSRQQEKLARQQAFSYSMLAKKSFITPEEEEGMLPALTIDYAYNNPNQSEFDYPERYTDMIHRFEDTRLNCLESCLKLGNKKGQKDEQQPTVVIFVTHAVGVNALLDGFRNRVTIPLESNYCSISCVRHYNSTVIADSSDQSDEDCEYMQDHDDGFNSPSKPTWLIDTVMYDRHLL